MSYHQQLQAYIEEYRRRVHAGPVQVADIAAWLIRRPGQTGGKRATEVSAPGFCCVGP